MLPRAIAVATFGLITANCGTSSMPTTQRSADGTSAPEASGISIDPAGTSIAFDRRLLGTNVPAWLGPERLSDPAFQAAAVESGTTLLRMPGGSWSNAYDWHACEVGDRTGCFWPEAARPTDFIDFLQATELEGMWTVSINDSAQSAAAAVAFFNGSVDDDTKLGVDRNGEDWATVGRWAALRADHGNPHPVGITLWEVGNEVYGGRPDVGGEQCANFGWEDVWTCDGREYVQGDADHDGYLSFRAAMLAVDPDIEVGAVGVGEPDGWSNWGNEVIDEAGDHLDFYIVHQYGFDQSPAGQAAVERSAEMWPEVMSEVTAALGADVPVAVTEYNLVSVNDNDTTRTMTQAMNALFVADSIGQLATHGAAIANQWNLANGLAANGTDYGLVAVDDFSRYPQFEALSRWSEVGTSLYPTTVAEEHLRAYATRHTNGDWTILVLNLGSSAVTPTLSFRDDIGADVAEMDSAWARHLTDTTLQTNLPIDVTFVDGNATVPLPAWSITTISISTSFNANEVRADA